MAKPKQKGPRKPAPKSAPVERRIATLDDFIIRRDDEGNLEPIMVPVVGIKGLTIGVLATTIGSLKGMSDPDGDATEWPLEDKVRFVREHVVVPDLSQVSAEDLVESMTLWDLDMLLVTAVHAGGPQRRDHQDGGAQGNE